jgi:hypothetical protein
MDSEESKNSNLNLNKIGIFSCVAVFLLRKNRSYSGYFGSAVCECTAPGGVRHRITRHSRN